MRGIIRAKRTTAFAAILVTLAAFGLVIGSRSPAFAQDRQDQDRQDQQDQQDRHGAKPDGAVFAMTNATDSNQIVSYKRAADGTLTRLRNTERTRGLGIGVDLDTQGGLRLSDDHRYLYAVNAGSDNVTVFSVNGARLRFRQIIDAGDEPVALTISGNLLYVLNGSVAGNGITGFHIEGDGTLTPLPDSFRKLSSPIAVPGNIQFSPDGHVILVTHKVTNELVAPHHIIDAFTIAPNGYASAMPIANESAGIRPFSLAFRSDSKLVAVESFNAADGASKASSYQLNADGTISVISASVPNGQTDVCWVLISADGMYAFTSNFGSGTISSYGFSPTGALTLISGAAASTGATSQPVDSSFAGDGHYLYQLLRGPGAVAAFGVAGAILTPLGVVDGGLPVDDGASGLAAY